MPEARNASSAIPGAGRIYFWGGATHDEGERVPEGPEYPSGYRGYTGKGQVDGLTYSPAEDSWGKIPPAPLPRLTNRIVEWTGDELLVWGADEEGLFTTNFRYLGALYNPEINSWRPMEDSGDTAVGGGMTWTGKELLVIGTDRSSQWKFAGYNPSTNLWRKLNTASSPYRFDRSLAWTGTSLLAGLDDGSVWIYDPTTDSWSQSPHSSSADLVGFNYGWGGGLYFRRGGSKAVGDVLMPPDKSGIAAYNPESNEWRAVSDPPIPVEALGAIYDVHGRALFLGGKQSLAYDPNTDRWESFPHFKPGTAFLLGETLYGIEGYTIQPGDAPPRLRLSRYEPA